MFQTKGDNLTNNREVLPANLVFELSQKTKSASMTFLFRNLPPPYTASTREFQDILPNGTQDMVCTRFSKKGDKSKIE